MEYAVGAKSTKPGSKATSRRAALSNGKPPRVPVGDLHVLDMNAQTRMSAMYDAVCGETGLVIIDGTWDDDYPNERCAACTDSQWMASFNEMQNNLLA